MIYLIGGPPKCGKTTLAKALSCQLGVSLMEADILQTIVQQHTPKKELAKKFPWSTFRKQTMRSNDVAYQRYTARDIVKAYTAQAKATYGAIEALAMSEIEYGNDHIVEGYQVEPRLASRLVAKYGGRNFRIVFLVKQDAAQMVESFQHATSPHDWILKRTKHKQTFRLIADMIAKYSEHIEKEAKKYNFRVIRMDKNFEKQLSVVKRHLTSS